MEKFIDNFFIKDVMNKSKMEDMGYVEEEKKSDNSSGNKYDENTEE